LGLLLVEVKQSTLTSTLSCKMPDFACSRFRWDS